MDSQKQIRDTFVYGTQYYRAPTPTPDEWESDLRNMTAMGLDVIQLRAQWRWNEPADGHFDFSDLDALFDLAAKHGKRVILKFLMETAPDYVFHQYEGYRQDMHGQRLRPGAMGSFYVGGWLPCFDNPKVVEKAARFVRVVTERYRDRRSLLLWNIWNEPRSRPVEECGCPFSIEAYRRWLQERYGTIDRLNTVFGKRWESFSTIEPPSMPLDYAEFFLWRRWALTAVTERLRFMYDVVHSVDPTRPIVSHVGICSVLQDVAADGSDDVANAAAVDFYGTSLPTEQHFDNAIDESCPSLICDRLRGVSPYFWIYELYPDWGGWLRPISRTDFTFKVWTTIACGSKGILFWQYRAERVGNENDLAGLTHIDGSPKPITPDVTRIGAFVKEHQAFLIESEVEEDGIGILYSTDSDLINRVENTGGERFWDFSLTGAPAYLYKKALIGCHALFRDLGYTVRWLDVHTLEQALAKVSLIYIPEAFMVGRETMDTLIRFTENGGKIIAEEGFGLRRENTWLRSRWPMDSAAELFGVRIEERVAATHASDRMNAGGAVVPAAGFISYLQTRAGAETFATWQDGRAATVLNNDSTCFIGTCVGATYYDSDDTARKDCVAFVSDILKRLNMEPSPWMNCRGLYFRRLRCGEEVMVFVFNRNRDHVAFRLDVGAGIQILTPDTVHAAQKKGQTRLVIGARETGILKYAAGDKSSLRSGALHVY